MTHSTSLMEQLAPLTGEVLAGVSAGPPMDRSSWLDGAGDPHRVRAALSGLWLGVDAVHGNKLCLPEQDFQLPGRFPISWSRFYSSALRMSGLLGPGWRTPWEVTLARVGDQLVYSDAHGRKLAVPFPAPGRLVIVPLERWRVAHMPDGRLIVVDLKAHFRVFGAFDKSGVARIKYIENAQGHRIGCLWDKQGRLVRMRGVCGYELRMHYGTEQPMRLAAIECAEGGLAGTTLVRYGYDQHGQLMEVRHGAGALMRRFAYQNGRMIAEVDALGMQLGYRWQMVGDASRVVARETFDGARERFHYDVEQRATRVTDVFGDTASWQYDEQGRVLAHTGFEGRVYRFEHGTVGGPSRLHLPNGGVVQVGYDRLWRVVSQTGPGDASRSLQHASFTGELIAMQEGEGRSWLWLRDEQLRVTGQRSPGSDFIGYAYSEDGLATHCIDAHGRVTVLEHDALGHVIKRTTPPGTTTHYGHDRNGYLIAITNAAGEVTRAERDPMGRLLTVIRPDGQSERHTWNAAGQRLSFVNVNGQARQWERNRRGQVVRYIDEEGNVTSCDRDAHGRLLRIESANGAVQTFTWSVWGCTSMTYADGTVRYFAYNKLGQITRVTEQAGNAARSEDFHYDDAGRLAGRDTAHSRYGYRYDQLGRLTSVRREPLDDGQWRGIGVDERRFEYDGFGRVLAEHGTQGALRYTYDPAGRQIAMTLPDGQVLQMRRSAAGDVTQLDWQGRMLARMWYDPMQRMVARSQGSLRTQIGYGALGQRAWGRSMVGSSVPSSEGDLRFGMQIHYSANGLVTEMQGVMADPLWHDYDRRGYLLRRVSDTLGIEYFTWDPAGNLTNMPAAGGAPHALRDHRLHESHGYRYEYDAWGQVIRRSGRGQPLELEWDVEGHLVAIRHGERTVRYRYDALGRRSEKIEEARTSDAAETLIRDTVTRYVWDGPRLLQEQHESAVHTYLYRPGAGDAAGFAPLAKVEQSLGANGEMADTRVYHYHTDVAGAAIALTDDAGMVVWRGHYRTWGTLATQEGDKSKPVTQPLRYPGHYADEETGLHYNGARYYDPQTGRYLSPDRTMPDGLSPYLYAPNPLTWCNPLGDATPIPTAGPDSTVQWNRGLPCPARDIARVVEPFQGQAGYRFESHEDVSGRSATR
ncbi:RHS repeat-associated core domain-containing protein [Dyella sp.]|uniref:RHS repeat-associated core domain-containing protein n=1 Tax=Dyella sp. TaxID=1869338 RepID=UPI002B499DF6|nr:RHS repeat-associated core domain-containing protein [Dyella sp.]HKT27469.1 RHS repeat-associated core domain-containing protein [Dyella sp.]